MNNYIHRRRNKSLGVLELIAIALGGMMSGGIFTVLGISVSLIGAFTPVAIALGGALAALAANPYVKMGAYASASTANFEDFIASLREVDKAQRADSIQD